jgi:hypothetical protein
MSFVDVRWLVSARTGLLPGDSRRVRRRELERGVRVLRPEPLEVLSVDVPAVTALGVEVRFFLREDLDIIEEAFFAARLALYAARPFESFRFLDRDRFFIHVFSLSFCAGRDCHAQKSYAL